ncbi:zinc ribbon domain-containing protein [Clostridium estertheticum]|uniref:Zinc ribbon domain-containing protein n=1 Tax=Clostridium estertheticum subsp. estertheticum TaxID=1552 RepID=A0A1J0GKK9_9CLOT|nr:zinc ribbon domain-containing protein [Clostridium estertheticum]APC41908.1 hypothetical protein A7L45_18480 [Clostridium estertheticum subsp. estertheticum]MBU3073237.1 zinc ribbon domain-containing protein [Clostridium estertheticum]MBU3163522.1 zinc ribbon domain-containing protein [Clostridium estertheticum]MBZ9616187.1 zinc ribbon domain-containing protein [Clostridium estertheticum subsp. laramiense]MCB2357829.1 zinc ribbon domain-containing protein [Clostridium estertheticum]
MTYCSNCGCKIEGDKLFCPNCGTKINQISSLNQKKEKSKEFSEPNFNSGEIINTLKTASLSPVSGGKDFIATAHQNHVIIITIILAFLQGLLWIWRVNQIVDNLQTISIKIASSFSSVIAEIFGQSSYHDMISGDLYPSIKNITQFKSFINMPYGKIFIVGCAIYLLGIFVLFILIYLGISMLSKTKFAPFTLFKAVIIATFPILSCEIISILFSYFSIYLGIFFIILGILISIITLNILIKENFKINENLCVLIVSISFLIALVTVFISTLSFITSNLPEVIGTTINLYNK